jgi:transposase
MIGPERRAEIRRLYFGEHWKVGTIAVELGIHPETVKRAIEVDGFVRKGCCKPSKLDPYLEFIERTLKQHPRLRATRIHEMIVSRGYSGSTTQTRAVVRRLRPVPRSEAYLRLETLPGEQGQVDWASFGKVRVGRAERSLSAFVMVLSWSRALHAVFFMDQQQDSFLAGHAQAFSYFGGVPRVLLYDNLRSVVLQRCGEAIQFHPRLLEFCGHYHFEPRPVAVARGNEKGRVERAIRYLRDRFFAARPFRDVADLNRQFAEWREEWADARRCPADKSMTVAQALEKEREVLMPLPEHHFACESQKPVRSGKTPYVRFDLNDYSIPYELVSRPLTLLATDDLVRILDGGDEVARHPRCFDRDQTIEDERHISALAEAKRSARQARGQSRLFAAAPEARAFLEQVVLRDQNLTFATRQLERLLDDYGPRELSVALHIAIERQTVTPASVAHLLEQERRRKRAAPPTRLAISDNPKVQNLRITPHALEKYDDLAKKIDADE